MSNSIRILLPLIFFNRFLSSTTLSSNPLDVLFGETLGLLDLFLSPLGPSLFHLLSHFLTVLREQEKYLAVPLILCLVAYCTSFTRNQYGSLLSLKTSEYDTLAIGGSLSVSVCDDTAF